MKTNTNFKTQNGRYDLFCVAITLALIALCSICTSLCMAQTPQSPLQDSLHQVCIESTKVNDSDIIHNNDVNLKSLPDSILLVLVDSLHGCCVPSPRGQIFSKFKYRGRHAHKGVDIPLHVGDDVYAAFDGVVRVVMPQGKSGGYGNLVVVKHDNGLETYYGHLSKYLVQSGDTLRAGELIGYGGSTGRSTSPHLHFETRYMGMAFDPERIFDFEKGTLRAERIALKKQYFSCHSQYDISDQQSLTVVTNPSSTTDSQPIYYKVQRGDSLKSIAEQNGTTVENIRQLSGITDKSYIYVGQRLRIK